MPCSSGHEDRIEAASDRDAIRRAALLTEELNRVTRYLCEACKILEGEGIDSALSKPAQEWWEEHKRFDAERGMREKKG
jgi:hypothetical protein